MHAHQTTLDTVGAVTHGSSLPLELFRSCARCAKDSASLMMCIQQMCLTFASIGKKENSPEEQSLQRC